MTEYKGMDEQLKEIFEAVDAAIFTGCHFDEDLSVIKEAKDYVDRWSRELTRHAQYAHEQKCIRHRISCKSLPTEEALYSTIEAFEKQTGLKFKEIV